MSSNPLFTPHEPMKPEPAIALVRSKVARAYGDEPAALDELARAQRDATPSKHQLYMRELSESGMSLAEIQTAWHHYYTKLPDHEKQEVWQEFYQANQRTPYQKLFQQNQHGPAPGYQHAEQAAQPAQTANGVTVSNHAPLPEQPYQPRTRPSHAKSLVGSLTKNPGIVRLTSSPTGKSTLKAAKTIKRRVSANGRLTMRHHLQSLLFGLGMGTIVLLVLLFGFFNEYVIAPFIQPSRKVNATPIIVTEQPAAQTAQPTIIIPKINIRIPVDFNLSAVDEATVQTSLENGVVHYPSTVKPGQNGNGAYFGHSSSNIFNNGKYKFAFVLLHQLTTGDIFYITFEGKVYAYQVFAREIVPPTQISVLNDTKGKQATAALITCDPPGLSTNRLVVWGEQISPSPANNTTPAATGGSAPEELSSNGPTLWTRIWRALDGNPNN